MQIHKLLLLCAVLLCTPAWTVNKCTGPDGKVSFQDIPCAGKGESLNVRPASGESKIAPQQNLSANQRPITETQRIEAQIAASQRQRRKIELEERLVPDAQGAVNYQRVQCDQQFKTLQDKKTLAKNNLAGATWENSISSEMSAIVARCDTRTRELKDELETLRKECLALNGCK